MSLPMRSHILAAILALAATVGGTEAAKAGPLSLEKFFNGPLVAKGTVDNIRDGTKRDFTITMQASWAGPRGTLVEDVAYADGERERKVWTFNKVAEGRFTGRRADVDEDAEVTEDAEGVHVVYKARTPVPAGLTLNLSFDDRLTPVSPTTVRVKSDVSYLFVSAATVTMTITKGAAKVK